MTVSASFHHRTLPRRSFADHYLTVSAPGGPAAFERFEALLARAAACLADNGVGVVQEKIYGALSARARVMEARRTAYRRNGVDPASPVTYVEGRAVHGGPVAGLQIWGVSARRPGRVPGVTVENAVGMPGRVVRGAGFRMLHLPAVLGAVPGRAAASMKSMFEKARRGVEANGFSFRQVRRTWIYLTRLLDVYDEFNDVRTNFYGREGLSDSNKNPFPASTAVQGRSRGEACSMDLLAVASHATPLLKTARQEDAFRYGSAFVRGMVVDIDGGRTVYVSGTSSIDRRGGTVFAGDAAAQARASLRAVGAVLKKGGCGFRDVAAATVFCKDVQAHRACREVLAEGRRTPFPAVFVLADVCRRDLAIEIEAVAAKKL